MKITDPRVEALRDHLSLGGYGLTTQECDAAVCAFDEIAAVVAEVRALVAAAEGESLHDAVLRGFAAREARAANAEAAVVLAQESADVRAKMERALGVREGSRLAFDHAKNAAALGIEEAAARVASAWTALDESRAKGATT